MRQKQSETAAAAAVKAAIERAERERVSRSALTGTVSVAATTMG